jgi:hypothetical protein
MSGQLRYDWNMGFYESINNDGVVKIPVAIMVKLTPNPELLEIT